MPLVVRTPAENTLVEDVLGRPLRDLRMSVIDACNFRCSYCMPASRVGSHATSSASDRLTFDEIESIARGFVLAGVRKIRLTGGEPLLRRGLSALIARLASIQGAEEIAITTNGALLARQAEVLRHAGLTRITVSLDTLDRSQFHSTTGRDGLVRVLEGIAVANAVGFKSIKINCVVRRNCNEDQVLPMAKAFRGTGNILRFIEFMDVGTCNDWTRGQVVESSLLRRLINAKFPIAPLQASIPGEVAERYRYVDGGGEVGFISSISTPFCSDCNRARVSSNGHFYTCLFSSSGTSLRNEARLGERAVEARVRQIWEGRGDRYSELRSLAPRRGSNAKRIEMFMIGG